MRKIKEILRLIWEIGLGSRQISRSCNVAHSTVNDILRRAKAAGLSWPLPEDKDDAALEAMLYTQPQQKLPAIRPQPEMQKIHRELRRKGVTTIRYPR